LAFTTEDAETSQIGEPVRLGCRGQPTLSPEGGDKVGHPVLAVIRLEQVCGIYSLSMSASAIYHQAKPRRHVARYFSVK
jgi:hypothetical protein